MKTPGDYLYRTPRPPRHPGRVAAACFFAAGLLMLAADRACPDELVALAGWGTTGGLGERAGAPEASLVYRPLPGPVLGLAGPVSILPHPPVQNPECNGVVKQADSACMSDALSISSEHDAR